MEKGGLHVVSGGSQQQPSHSLPPTKETDDDNSAAVEVERLKAEVVELKAEVERLKRLVVALTLANANQPTTHEDEDGLTEDEALAPSTAKQPWPPFCKEDVPPPCKEAAAKFAAASSEP